MDKRHLCLDCISRAYLLFLSLPLVLALTGMVRFFVDDAGGGVTGWSLFATAVLLQVLFALTVACPRCGKSPYTVGPTRGPFGIAGKPVPDATCSKCGYDLRTRAKPKGE